MKKQLFILFGMLTMTVAGFAQTSFVPVKDIQFVSATDLANCKDLSAYDGQTIKTVGVVMHDGNLTELSSGSVNGGYRPGVHILDTSVNGSMGGFAGLHIHGVFANQQSQPVDVLDNLVAGMIIEVTGVVANYQGETQFYPLDNSSVSVIGSTSAPQAQIVDLAKLNDNSRANNYTTGEEWEGSLVSIENVTVVSVSIFSGNRVSFDVSDANGNLINVSDRFLVQKLPARTIVNPSSPQSAGTFVPPIVGTKYEKLSGIVMHSQDGCSGGTGRGYELNPFDTSHYKVGDTPPSITSVTRTPLVPTSTNTVKVAAKIIDFNGTVASQKLYYSTDINQDIASFTSVSLTLKSGSTDEFEGTIPAFADGTIVRYYLTATDNDGNTSYEPFSAGSANPSTAFYTVRNAGLTISDIQKTLTYTGDASPYLGQTVTVKGYITASAKPYDLEDIYMQEKDATEWGGIKLTGNSDLLDLWRTEEVEITGLVEESFGFTQINVSKVTKTGNKFEVQPVEIAVSDSAAVQAREIEKYEGMLVKVTNASGKVVINNPRLNPFGEWTIADSEDAPFIHSTKVQTGVKNGNNNSSLWVSVVSDDTLANDGGIMEVPAIKATKGMTMDAMIGVLYYGFGQYSLKPRNNDDIVNFSETLEETNYADTLSSGSIASLATLGVRVYPNPATSQITVNLQNESNGVVTISSLQGKVLAEQTVVAGLNTINVADFPSGVYTLLFTSNTRNQAVAKFIKL